LPCIFDMLLLLWIQSHNSCGRKQTGAPICLPEYRHGRCKQIRDVLHGLHQEARQGVKESPAYPATSHANEVSLHNLPNGIQQSLELRVLHKLGRPVLLEKCALDCPKSPEPRLDRESGNRLNVKLRVNVQVPCEMINLGSPNNLLLSRCYHTFDQLTAAWRHGDTAFGRVTVRDGGLIPLVRVQEPVKPHMTFCQTDHWADICKEILKHRRAVKLANDIAGAPE